MIKILLAVATFLNMAQAGMNECKQYLSCPECLDIKNMTISEYGNRPNCGWCHVPIKYEDGKEGARCADVRDDPWNCGDQFDTSTCSPGWACDESTHKCIMAVPGDGFGSRTTCQQYCGNPGPPPQEDKYRCNTTTYTCNKCEKGHDEDCSPNRGAACDNCKNPDPTKLFKCDRTDKDHPQCKPCPKNSTAGCMSQAQACNSCAPPPKLMECDPKTLTCVTAKSGGTIKQACDAQCGHITPQELLGTWRGLMAKKGAPPHFDMGEIDLVFGDKNLTVIYPNRTQNIYDVATTGGSVLILQKGNETIRVVHNLLAYLKHTTAAGLSTYGPGKPAPDSFKTGMTGSMAEDLIMWKCNSWGGSGTCKFSAKNKTEEAEAEAKKEIQAVMTNDVDGSDGCNAYGDCHSCIQA